MSFEVAKVPVAGVRARSRNSPLEALSFSARTKLERLLAAGQCCAEIPNRKARLLAGFADVNAGLKGRSGVLLFAVESPKAAGVFGVSACLQPTVGRQAKHLFRNWSACIAMGRGFEIWSLISRKINAGRSSFRIASIAAWRLLKSIALVEPKVTESSSTTELIVWTTISGTPWQTPSPVARAAIQPK